MNRRGQFLRHQAPSARAQAQRLTGSFILLTVVLAAPLAAEVSFADGRLLIDGLLWTRADIGQSVTQGWTKTWVNFKCPAALLGLTGKVSAVATVRVYFDVLNRTPLDLYTQVQWPNGLSVKAGQFKLPLGFDVMAQEAELKLGSNTFLYWYGKPVGPRDIGVLLAYDHCWLNAAAALVNGTGPNSYDNNNYKDLGGRVEVRPVKDLRLAGNGYYGRTDSAGVQWVLLGAEAAYDPAPLAIQAEFKSLRHGTTQLVGGYFQLAYDFGLLEPAGHIDAVFPQGKDEQPDVVLTAGLNIKPLANRLKIMLTYHLHKAVARWTYYEYGLQLQAAL